MTDTPLIPYISPYVNMPRDNKAVTKKTLEHGQQIAEPQKFSNINELQQILKQFARIARFTKPGVVPTVEAKAGFEINGYADMKVKKSEKSVDFVITLSPSQD